MSGTFSHLNRDHARLTHVFDDGASITIDYRPGLLTPRQLHRITALSARPMADLSTEESIELMDSTQRLLANLLIAWDARDEQGQPIPPTFEGLEDVDYDAQSAVLGWIQDDQRAGKANANGTSQASSTPDLALPVPVQTMTSSPNAPNGTAPAPLPNGSV